MPTADTSAMPTPVPTLATLALVGAPRSSTVTTMSQPPPNKPRPQTSSPDRYRIIITTPRGDHETDCHTLALLHAGHRW